MATAGDIGGGALSGAGTGAAIGSVLPGVGTAIGAGVGAVAGALAGVGKWLFGRSEARRAKQQYADLQKQIEERQQKAIASGEERAEGLYGKYAINPDQLKQEYSQYLQRGVQQQTGGMTSALASLRGGINPALAAHMLTNRAADTGALAAGQGALAQAQLGMQADMYNKQMMERIRNQEINLSSGLMNTQNQLDYASLQQQQKLRSEGIEGAFNMLSTGAGIGMQLSGLGNKLPTGGAQPMAAQPYSGMYNQQPSLGLTPYSPTMFNPFQPSAINPMGGVG